MKDTPENKLITVEEYINSQSEHFRPTLKQIREIGRAAAPNAIEKMSYQMPSFWDNGMVMYYAVFTKHYGLYIPPKVLLHFKDRLTTYKLAKATIQIPIGQPIPEKLLTEIIRYTVKENLIKKILKEAAKKI